MAFVYRRKNSPYWWMCWTDTHGVEQRASSNNREETEARALANELEAQAQARSSSLRKVRGALTVEQFFDETWLPLRQRTRLGRGRRTEPR